MSSGPSYIPKKRRRQRESDEDDEGTSSERIEKGRIMICFYDCTHEYIEYRNHQYCRYKKMKTLFIPKKLHIAVTMFYISFVSYLTGNFKELVVTKYH